MDVDAKKAAKASKFMLEKTMHVGDDLLNLGENLIGDVADNTEDIVKGAIEFVLPGQLTENLKKDYIVSFVLEMLPILVFVMYYNYY